MTGETEETRKKATEFYEKLTLNEIQTICHMNVFERNQYVTEKFGNASERFGVSFGLFPMWTKTLLDMVESAKVL